MPQSRFVGLSHCWRDLCADWCDSRNGNLVWRLVMNHSDLIARISEAAQYNIIAETGYVVDVNGRTKALNANDRFRHSGMCNRILNEVLMELCEETKVTQEPS